MAHDTANLTSTLVTLFDELVLGAGPASGFVLNPGDPGLLASLDRLDAREASAEAPAGGASIAAHVDHVRYGLSLMNRWAAGEDPFATATWDLSWKRGTVTDAEWKDRRAALSREAEAWRRVLGASRQVDDTELSGLVASVAHLAYHLGAIRQINKTAQGPREGNN